jgi:hypothetical protein
VTIGGLDIVGEAFTIFIQHLCVVISKNTYLFLELLLELQSQMEKQQV